jgi:hypothetical protein
MWSALLRILELLIKAVHPEITPDQLRRSLAKDLAKIYMEVDEIVNRGREFLSFFDADSLVVNDVKIDILLAQQDALHSVRDHLERVAPLLAIQLPPQTATLNLLIEGKWQQIMFLLNWFLYDAPDRTRVPLLDTHVPPGYLARLVHLDGPLPESERDVRDLWIQPLAHEDWSAESRSLLIATPEDLVEARDTLNRIAAIAGDLRQFLVERLNVEDLF